MKARKIFVIALLVAFFTIQIPSSRAGFDDFFKSVKKTVSLEDELSESKIIEGLKEALEIGTSNAVKIVSKADGYYENPKIKIPLPESVRKVEKVLRAVGYGDKIDA